VLVSQLRDYLSAGWGKQVVTDRTTHHPLQAFSRRYFEQNGTLLTYAREWRAAHGEQTKSIVAALPAYAPDPDVPLTISALAMFLRNPVKAFFRQRLLVTFENHEEENDDEECFAVENLDEYKLIKNLLSTATVKKTNAEAAEFALQALQRLRRAGGLPFKGFGDLKQQDLQQTLTTMLRSWFDEQARFPDTAERQSVRVQAGAVVLEDWIDQLRSGAEFAGAPAWLELEPGKLCVKDKKEATPRLDKLPAVWIRSLAIAASGLQAHGVLVGRDSVIEIAPMSQETAITTLTMLLELWLAGMQAPLPLPPKTALVWIEDKHKAAANYEGGYRLNGEVDDAYLARVYPDFEALSHDDRFAMLSEQVYGQLREWAAQHVTARHHATTESGQAA